MSGGGRYGTTEHTLTREEVMNGRGLAAGEAEELPATDPQVASEVPPVPVAPRPSLGPTCALPECQKAVATGRRRYCGEPHAREAEARRNHARGRKGPPRRGRSSKPSPPVEQDQAGAERDRPSLVELATALLAGGAAEVEVAVDGATVVARTRPG